MHTRTARGTATRRSKIEERARWAGSGESSVRRTACPFYDRLFRGEKLRAPALDPAEFLRDAFAVDTSGDVRELVIEIEALVAPYVQERFWHESAQFEPLDGGGGASGWRSREPRRSSTGSSAWANTLRWSPHVSFATWPTDAGAQYESAVIAV